MNGNITQEGIRLDSSGCNRIGSPEFQNFDAALSTPRCREASGVHDAGMEAGIKYAIGLGDRFGMEWRSRVLRVGANRAALGAGIAWDEESTCGAKRP